MNTMQSLFDTVRVDKHPWTRRDAIRSCQNKRNREKLFTSFLSSTKPNTRFAVAKRDGKNYHIVGIGIVKVKTFDQLKEKAREFGFTKIRFGAIKTSL
jgi:hypothetical protein